ncbi:hypothetical protein [Actinomadura latina]|uniref:Lipoprotein n=1 Tax=Actinomadura latina TaxID=163603 RepID=A0A846Z7Q1_9ACTN|nr:hypothetical protein [Actinomadura latina]NKZ06136.1 hypothetical protein [Actinomadura latina]
MNRFRTIGLGLVAAAALTVSATPAMAAPASPAAPVKPAKACPPDVYYKVKSKKQINYWVGRHFVDGKGGKITGRVERSVTKSATLEAGAEASVGAVWATVKANVSKSATKSNTVTVGHWYEHKISKNRYGHLRYRVIGYKVLFEKYRTRGNCKDQFLDAFYGNIPTSKEGWKYWETKKA